MSVNRTTVYTVHHEHGEYHSDVSLHRVADGGALLILETPEGNSQALVNPDRLFALVKTYISDQRQKEPKR